MTDRVRALTVILVEDIRDDDVEGVVRAIEQMRRVALVEKRIVTSADHLARMTARSEIRLQLSEAIDRVLDARD